MIRRGGLLIFPDSYGAEKPDGPDMVSCPECGEDRWATDEPCPHCGDPGPEGER